MRVCEKKKVSMREGEISGVRVREGEDSQKKSGREKKRETEETSNLVIN